jgi:hypothetical protein
VPHPEKEQRVRQLTAADLARDPSPPLVNEPARLATQLVLASYPGEAAVPTVGALARPSDRSPSVALLALAKRLGIEFSPKGAVTWNYVPGCKRTALVVSDLLRNLRDTAVNAKAPDSHREDAFSLLGQLMTSEGRAKLRREVWIKQWASAQRRAVQPIRTTRSTRTGRHTTARRVSSFSSRGKASPPDDGSGGDPPDAVRIGCPIGGLA